MLEMISFIMSQESVKAAAKEVATEVAKYAVKEMLNPENLKQAEKEIKSLPIVQEFRRHLHL